MRSITLLCVFRSSRPWSHAISHFSSYPIEHDLGSNNNKNNKQSSSSTETGAENIN